MVSCCFLCGKNCVGKKRVAFTLPNLVVNFTSCGKRIGKKVHDKRVYTKIFSNIALSH